MCLNDKQPIPDDLWTLLCLAEKFENSTNSMYQEQHSVFYLYYWYISGVHASLTGAVI